MDLKKIQESRLAEMKNSQLKLVEGWNPYIAAVDTYLAKKGKPGLTELDKRNVAQCLENSLIESSMKSNSRIFEGTTYSSDIAFLGVQLPVISALLPSLVLNQIGIVQALDRRQGAVFYLDVKYNDAKGAVQANGTMIGAKTGHDSSIAGRRYASQRVYHETYKDSCNGTDVAFNHTAVYFPMVTAALNTVVVTWISGGNTYTMTNSASVNVLTGAYGSGTINPTTGDMTILIASSKTPTALSVIYVDYMYDYQKTTHAIPGVNVNLTASTITAEDFPLRADYTLGASIDLQKAHGLNLEDELVKFLGGQIKFEIDHLGIDMMLDAALSVDGAGPAPSFTATVDSGQEWIWRKFMFLDNIEAGSNLIFSKTLRGFANFIVCGNNVARLIRQLAPHFVADKDLGSVVPTGPYVMGTLDGRIVIHDPFLATNRYLLGYKGDNYLMAGFIYAPYIPLMTTPTLLTADLKAQKGFLSSAGFLTVNPGMYAYGDITGMQA